MLPGKVSVRCGGPGLGDTSWTLGSDASSAVFCKAATVSLRDQIP
jgi:hypothetical protein